MFPKEDLKTYLKAHVLVFFVHNIFKYSLHQVIWPLAAGINTMSKNLKPIHLDYSGAGYSPSALVKRSIYSASKQADCYPYEGYDMLHEKIAEYCKTESRNIYATNGGDEAIELLVTIFGRKMLVPIPTYNEYEYIGKSRNSEIRYKNCLRDDNSYSLNYTKADLKWATLVWICNPNNPTGSIIPREDILWVLDNTDAIVAVDEAYYEFAGNSVVDLIKKYKNLVVLRTFSKGFGLAGLRLGYMVSDSPRISSLKAAAQEFNVNRIARAAGIAALSSLGYYKKRIASMKRLRDEFEQFALGLGIYAFKSNGGFAFLKFKSIAELEKIYVGLKNKGIFVFKASDSEFTGLKGPYMRIAIGNRGDLSVLKKELKSLMQKQKLSDGKLR
jgi:histidinol-phosphate aminotransferase